MNAFHESPDDLVTGFLRQSYAGAVRQRLLAIERAVQSGQRHELIVQGLEQGGIKASMGTFRKSLSRARIWWRKQLLMQMAQQQAAGNGQGNDLLRHAGIAQGDASTRDLVPIAGFANQVAHSPPNAGQSAVVMPRPASPPEVTPGLSVGRQVPRTRSPVGAGRVDLDQFFKPKSVFTKT